MAPVELSRIALFHRRVERSSAAEVAEMLHSRVSRPSVRLREEGAISTRYNWQSQLEIRWSQPSKS